MYDGRTQESTASVSRSTLYHLQPIGGGTSGVESLTGYVTRLADAHSVDTRTLVLSMILPQFESIYVAQPHLLKSFWLSASTSLNGISTSAINWLQSLGGLTLRNDLRPLTMLTWQHVLTNRSLLRRTQAWCPTCYNEWRECGQSLYHPLLWTLEVITHCIPHQQPLQSRCPNPKCHAHIPFLSAFGSIGSCPRCQQWLGETLGYASETKASTETKAFEWQQWMTHVVGNMLAAAGSLPIPPDNRCAEVLSTAHAITTAGSIRALAEHVQMSERGIHDIVLGRRVPQLETLLRICYCLGTTPLQLLTQAPIPATNTPPDRLLNEPRFHYRHSKPFDLDYLERGLKQIIADNEIPPPSMAEVARRFGYDQSNLSRRFPELCRTISLCYRSYRKAQRTAQVQTWLDEIRYVMRTLHNKGIYPSYTQIRRHLSCPDCVRLAEARLVRREMMIELGLGGQ